MSQPATQPQGESIFKIKEGTILSLILHLQKGQNYVSILPRKQICVTCWRVVRYASADHRTYICGSSVQWLGGVLEQCIVIRRLTKIRTHQTEALSLGKQNMSVRGTHLVS